MDQPAERRMRLREQSAFEEPDHARGITPDAPDERQLLAVVDGRLDGGFLALPRDLRHGDGHHATASGGRWPCSRVSIPNSISHLPTNAVDIPSSSAICSCVRE